ncbi:MAG: hypothetical protein A3G75_03615 [Verrucomicrobia bacterium RIFCSPLOWO2_12_FULL_64_8]|nr:MAG: hypothetical protein A3G75_03615 [Verrucomicrobia bacterium RIFCSPLOWO2_12_FULL_64_8]
MKNPSPATTDAGSRPGDSASRRLGFAWIALCIALAVHVTDEAATDFLSVYNPTAAAIRNRFPLLPLPTFTFGVWLAGLCAAIVILLGLSRPAFRGSRAVLWLAYPFAVLMFMNGLGHIGGSFYRGNLMPGVYSSPLLLLASAWLFVCARRSRRMRGMS